MRRLINFLMILFCFGQYSCSPEWPLYKAEKITNAYSINGCEKALKLYKKAYNRYGDRQKDKGIVSFKIAECYRIMNDTSCKVWYENSIRLIRRSFNSCRCSKEYKIELIKSISVSYYYLSDYNKAISGFKRIIFYGKCIELKYINYYIDCLKKLDREQEIELFYNDMFQLIKENSIGI